MDIQTLIGSLTYEPQMAIQPALSLEELHSNCPYIIQLMGSPPSTTHNGPPGRLPLELIFKILEQLPPILSLLQFWSTCQYAKYVVDSVPSFRAVVQHALHLLYTILILNPSKDISLSGMVSILRRTRCDLCGVTAQNVWIPTASRICLVCMRSQTIICTEEELVGRFGISVRKISALVRYPFAEAYFCRYRSHGITHIPPNTVENVTEPDPFPEPSFMYDIPEVWELTPPSDRRGICWQPVSRVPGIIRWSVALLAVPWVVEEKIEMGYHCSTCLYTTDQDRIYTLKEFEEHLETCRVRPFGRMSINRKKRWTRKGRHFLEAYEDRLFDEEGW